MFLSLLNLVLSKWFHIFCLFLGVISQSIVKKGGTEISRECYYRNGGDFGPFVRVTGGYALNCKHIIHVVTPTTIDEYSSRMMLALRAADSLKLQSIAIPTIGTGKIYWSKQVWRYLSLFWKKVLNRLLFGSWNMSKMQFPVILIDSSTKSFQFFPNFSFSTIYRSAVNVILLLALCKYYSLLSA